MEVESISEEGQLWARVLESKYGGWRGLDEAHRGIKESIWWRDLKTAFQTSQQGEDLKKGNGGIESCGGLIRNNNGQWKGGFAKYIGRSSVFVAKL